MTTKPTENKTTEAEPLKDEDLESVKGGIGVEYSTGPIGVKREGKAKGITGFGTHENKLKMDDPKKEGNITSPEDHV